IGIYVTDRYASDNCSLMAVVEGDLGGDLSLRRAVVQRFEQRTIAIDDVPAANFLRTRKFTIVWIKLFMQHKEAADLCACHDVFFRKGPISLVDVLRDHIVDQWMASELLIRAIDNVVALGPASPRRQVDIDHGTDKIATGAYRNRLADVGIIFELVFDVFRRKQRAIFEPADVFDAIDDL